MAARHTQGLMLVNCLLGVLSALQWVRLGSFQSEDILLLLLLAYCIAKFLYSGFLVRVPLTLSLVFKSYVLLILSLLLISVLSIRLPFYQIDEPSLLERPLIYSLSKDLQFATVVCGFLWLAVWFQRKRSFLRAAMTAYWATGIISSVYAILCFFLVWTLHLSPAVDSFAGAFYDPFILRARGFFNEGGPFGIYLVSVVLIGLLRRNLTGRRIGIWNLVILFLAFLLSASRTGLLVMVLLFLFSILSAASLRKRLYYIILAAIIISVAAVVVDLKNVIISYATAFQTVEQQTDPKLATGRVSGFYIVPRMIIAHPLTGIGLGNYPLMRNDPLYRGPLPVVTFGNDMPALGIPGTAAEIGIPVTLWLFVLVLVPYWTVRKRASILGTVAMFQPIAHVLGVQFTFFYPWFVSACALAAAVHERDFLYKSDQSIKSSCDIPTL